MEFQSFLKIRERKNIARCVKHEESFSFIVSSLLYTFSESLQVWHLFFLYSQCFAPIFNVYNISTEIHLLEVIPTSKWWHGCTSGKCRAISSTFTWLVFQNQTFFGCKSLTTARAFLLLYEFKTFLGNFRWSHLQTSKKSGSTPPSNCSCIFIDSTRNYPQKRGVISTRSTSFNVYFF